MPGLEGRSAETPPPGPRPLAALFDEPVQLRARIVAGDDQQRQVEALAGSSGRGSVAAYFAHAASIHELRAGLKNRVALGGGQCHGQTENQSLRHSDLLSVERQTADG